MIAESIDWQTSLRKYFSWHFFRTRISFGSFQHRQILLFSLCRSFLLLQVFRFDFHWKTSLSFNRRRWRRELRFPSFLLQPSLPLHPPSFGAYSNLSFQRMKFIIWFWKPFVPCDAREKSKQEKKGREEDRPLWRSLFRHTSLGHLIFAFFVHVNL